MSVSAAAPASQMLDTRQLLQPMVDKQIEQTKKAVALTVATQVKGTVPGSTGPDLEGKGQLLDVRA